MHGQCSHQFDYISSTSSKTYDFPLCHCQCSSLLTFWPTNGLGKGGNLSFRGEGLLDLARCRGSGLAAHAGGVDCFRWDQIQVFIIWNLIQPVAVLQELDVQVLVDLLQEQKMADTELAENLDKQSLSSIIINGNTSYSDEPQDKQGTLMRWEAQINI